MARAFKTRAIDSHSICGLQNSFRFFCWRKTAVNRDLVVRKTKLSLIVGLEWGPPTSLEGREDLTASFLSHCIQPVGTVVVVFRVSGC
jgi:hypothetical protein